MSSTAHAVAPPVHAAAPPVQRAPEPKPETQERPQRLPASLSSVPAVQRKCTACEAQDREERMPVQPRLEVGPIDDPYEREADDIAGRVMAMREPGSASAAAATVQRACSACSSKFDEVQRAPLLDGKPLRDLDDLPRMRPEDSAAGTEHIAASAAQLTSGGRGLSGRTRGFFERRMGRDLSSVRIHENGEARALNASIRARAFTYKNHIWLGARQSAAPSFTLAHELAHVMQQTAPGPVGPQTAQPWDADLTASAGVAAVQRRKHAFWLPGKTLSAARLHSSMHDSALDAIRNIHGEIISEVPIPGANRKLVDVGASGRADLYTATPDLDSQKVMVPGVKQAAAPTSDSSDANDATQDSTPPSQAASKAPTTAGITALANFSSTFVGMEQGSTPVSHNQRRAPKIKAGQLTDLGSAPTNIRIGEMKPAHDMDYRKSGAKQIANYIAGINAVADKVNQVSQAPSSRKWKPNAKVMNTTSLIPNGWDAGVSHSDWPIKNLKIRHYKPTRAKTKSGRRKVKAANAKQGRPKSQAISGRWMMAADNESGNQGVVVYFLAPNPTELATALGPASTRTTFRRLSTKLEKIKHDLIAPPKASASSGAKVQPRRLPAQTPLPSASPAPARLVRKEVKDDFKAADWEQARTGKGLQNGATDNSLLGEYGDIDNDLREDVAEKGAMVEWLKTKPPTKGTAYADKLEYGKLLTDLKLLKGVDFWTGIKAKPFGILREKFGLFFVKAYQKAAGFAEKIREKFKSFKKDKILAGKKGTIIKAAAKVASVVLPRLAKPFLAKMFDTIIQCGITGFEAKFRELIEGSFIEDVIETADQLKGKVENLATDVEAYFKGLIDKAAKPIVEEFETFVSEAKLVMNVVSMVKEITQALRIGSCVAGLAAAPETVGIGAVVGCGAALGDFILSKLGLSPLDHLIGTILSSCDMQNKIGRLMAGIGFIKTLPRRAGKAIITEVKTLLKNSDALKGLGSVKGKDFALHASELFCNPNSLKFAEMGYETSDCSNTGSYRQSKTGSYEIPEGIQRYKKRKQKPIPPQELPWKGVEIPVGRESQLAPLPSETPNPPSQNSGQAATAGTGSGDTAANGGQQTNFDVSVEEVRNITTTPKEFEAIFIHGVERGFRTDSSGSFDENTAGGCYSKSIKISILDTYGFHQDDRKVAVKICKLDKVAGAPYPKTPNKVWFKPDADVRMVVKDEAGNPLVVYAMRGGRRYWAWLGERRPD